MLKGWIVILGDRVKTTVSPTSLIKGLLKPGEETLVIPIFPNKIDAEYYAALFCKKNENIKDVMILDVASLLGKAQTKFDILMKDSTAKPSFLERMKKFFTFSS